MSKLVSFVVEVNEQGQVSVDFDGTYHWIETLFEPFTNVFDLDKEDYVLDKEATDKALKALQGVLSRGQLVEGLVEGGKK